MPGPTAMSPWRFVVGFGVVSLLADIVYEGARAVTGPYLASLGASAVLVGLITGAGEAFALAGRLVSGPLTDRTRAYWPLAFGGYTLTVASVPLLGLATGLWSAGVLVIAERAGKAARSPAKDVLISHAAAAVGRGRGFAVHEALDQLGALVGPLVVAGILVLSAGDFRPAFYALAIPGVAVLVALARLWARVPNPAAYEPAVRTTETATVPTRLSSQFWTYLTFAAATTAGFAGFGLLAFHLATHHLVPVAVIPVVYAAAMAVGALAALLTGWCYDRAGVRILMAVPILTALIPPLAFQDNAIPAVVGALLWGAVLGAQESTLRATVADLVPAHRRGAAYGVFAAGSGLAAFVGSALLGLLYTRSLTAVVSVTAAIQLVALLVFVGGGTYGARVKRGATAR
ncbi:MFS transporter [Nocardia sp. NPDC049707]|uniref:MFS transporter n=1 Tax=Nocardia sp. NPDC049707 TaxID=3154735 RepID=UPI00344330BF